MRVKVSIAVLLILSLIPLSYCWKLLLVDKTSNSSPDNKTQAEVSTVSANEKTKKASIIIGGDVMLARWVEQKTLKAGGWDKLFEKIKDPLTSADCAIVNLESPMKGEKPQTQIGSMIFAAKPESVEALVSSGIDAVSLANNHITDQGLAGLEETTKTLNDKKIAYVGADKTVELATGAKIIECGGMKIALVASTYGTNMVAEGVSVANLEDVMDSIKNTSETADYVITYSHWGAEYNASASPYQKDIAHKYVDAGADLVIGSHPHVLQPIEIYKDKVIAYSLGNLVFDQAPSGSKTEGALLKVDIDGVTQNFEILPIQIENYFQPVIAEDASSHKASLGIENLKWSLDL